MNPRSVLRITAIVAALGAVGGAVGGIVIAAVVAVSGGLRGWEMFRIAVVIASLFGAVGGMVLGPLYAWTLLRRAPLWRAITETAFAAAVTVGLIFRFTPSWPWNDWSCLARYPVELGCGRHALAIRGRSQVEPTSSARRH